MAALVGATTTQTEDTNTTSIDIFHPGTPAVDDLLWVTLTVDGGRLIIPATGWTTVEVLDNQGGGSFVSTWCGYRLYELGDPTFWTFAWEGPETAIGTMTSITGHDVADVIDVSGLGTGNDRFPTCPDITTNVPDTLLIRWWGQDECGTGATPPAGLTELWNLCCGNGSPGATSAGGHEDQLLAGPTGTAVWSGAGNSRWTAFTVAINPAPAPQVAAGGSSLGEIAAFETEWRGEGFFRV